MHSLTMPSSLPLPQTTTHHNFTQVQPALPELGRGGRQGGRIGTNLQNEGLISADRGTKATLTLTIPCSLFKSYTKDFSFPTFELVFQYRPCPLLCEQRYRYNIMILDHPER